MTIYESRDRIEFQKAIDKFYGRVIIKTWDESLHPRDENGRFTDGGSLSGSSSQSVSSQGANTPCTGFKSQDRLEYHYNKHISEFGEISIEEYQQKGINFLSQPCGDDILGYSYYDKTEQLKKVVRFNSKTTEYATGYPDKHICTYFKAKYDKKHQIEKPENAMKYYLNTKRKDCSE